MPPHGSDSAHLPATELDAGPTDAPACEDAERHVRALLQAAFADVLSEPIPVRFIEQLNRLVRESEQ